MTSGSKTWIRSNQWRLSFLRTVIVLVTLLLLLRLFSLQVLQYDSYSALASVRHDFSSILTPERGSILIKEKNKISPVAINKKAENLIISPQDIIDEENVAQELADITSLNFKEVRSYLEEKGKRYRLIKKDLSVVEIEKIVSGKKEGKLPQQGVWLESEIKRYYPEGAFLSHTLGFVSLADASHRGAYGLESSFDEILSGTEGRLEAAADAAGGAIRGSFRKLLPAKNGGNLVLTIDRAIQAKAEKVLVDYTERFGADGGSVIIVNPKTGDIMAMVSVPSFNPNEYGQVESIEVFTNPVVQSRYEPGSIIKPLTMAVGIETGKVKPSDTFYDTGKVQIGDHTIQNSDGKAYEQQTMIEVLEKSLNTGIVFVQRKIDKDVFLKYLERLRLNQKTGIALPGEIAGDLKNLNSKSDIAFATAAFGQGISLTPIGLIQAYTSIANGGEMKKINIISEVQNPDGGREVVEPETLERIFSPVSAATVASMMVNVVENGHGKRAAAKGYYIAGKTGTAQVSLPDRRGYDPDKTIGSFIGFGPVENPAFLMLVKIDNPKGVNFAESTAAPAFGEIAKFILDYLQVPPTRPLE